MNKKLVSGTMLTMLFVGVLALAFNIRPVTSEESLFRFDVEIEPEYPTVYDEVNVTVIFFDVSSISIGFEFGPLIRVENEFSIDINVTIPLILLWGYVGEVAHTYRLEKLSGGSYNFSASIRYWFQWPGGTWLSFDYSYGESFTVLRERLPWVKVEPELFGAQRIGEEFIVDLRIQGVEPDMRLVALEFSLQYDNTLLEVVNVTEGDYLSKFAGYANEVDPEDGYGVYFFYLCEEDYLLGFVLYYKTIWPPEVFPEGDGTLASIRFRVIYGPPYKVSSELILDAQAMNVSGDVIPCNTRNGRYMSGTRQEDVNCDGKVDLKDLYLLAQAFGTHLGNERWHYRADVDRNGVVNLIDVVKTAKAFGASDP